MTRAGCYLTWIGYQPKYLTNVGKDSEWNRCIFLPSTTINVATCPTNETRSDHAVSLHKGAIKPETVEQGGLRSDQSRRTIKRIADVVSLFTFPVDFPIYAGEHDNPRVSCKQRQAKQTDCLIPLIIRVKSSNQSGWLASVYTIPLDCHAGEWRLESTTVHQHEIIDMEYINDRKKYDSTNSLNSMISKILIYFL